MKTYNTAHIAPGSIRSQTERDFVYNGLDCAITAEVLEVLLPQLDSTTSTTYRFSRDLQAPVLEMRLRGVKVDQRRKSNLIDELFEHLDRLETSLERIVVEVTGMPEFNWRSPKQLQELFYEQLCIQVIRKQGRPTVDRTALERMEAHSVAKPIVRYLEAMRDLDKKISVLKTEIDHDGRMRTSYNIGGTNTGRLSSSFSEFGTGTNLQNIEESLRSIFIADKGMKLAYLDAEQGESRVVGAIEFNLFGDARYLDTCERGDLHTNVAKLCWPQLPWPGTQEADRALAEQPYYRHYDRRFMCKKIGHGTNYGGRPATLARQAKVEIDLIEQFQPIYFKAFPAHLQWHAHVKRQLQSTGKLTSLTGRRRQFWGRRNDDSTLREAIAYDPQGSLADIVNAGMLNVWKANSCQLLMQIHDAILVQYPTHMEDEIVPKIQEQLRHPIELKNGRQLIIPYGCATGWNWGKYGEDNQDGLRTYKPCDKRIRQSEAHIMGRSLRQSIKSA